jgi:hypothetical protein
MKYLKTSSNSILFTMISRWTKGGLNPDNFNEECFIISEYVHVWLQSFKSTPLALLESETLD